MTRFHSLQMGDRNEEQSRETSQSSKNALYLMQFYATKS